ncbi:MAG: C40 family peptidase, partial [Leptotrichiaceae bacterium]
IIDFAKTKLGSPYVWGATGPNSFDCSGFVGYVYQKTAGLVLPRVSRDQAEFRPRISSMNMKKGDLVFFETTGKGVISHVGIYMGDRQFIHASSGSNMRVTISSLDTNYYSKAFRWAVNPFN